MAADDVIVEDNIISGNNNVGILITDFPSGGVTARSDDGYKGNIFVQSDSFMRDLRASGALSGNSNLTITGDLHDEVILLGDTSAFPHPSFARYVRWTATTFRDGQTVTPAIMAGRSIPAGTCFVIGRERSVGGIGVPKPRESR